MTDNEIIEVFENCIVKQRCDWQACPYYDFDRCEEEVAKDALSLINRQKAEIERLQHTNKEISLGAVKILEMRDETIKAFAGRLMNALDRHGGDYAVYGIVDDIVKEMTSSDEL